MRGLAGLAVIVTLAIIWTRHWWLNHLSLLAFTLGGMVFLTAILGRMCAASSATFETQEQSTANLGPANE